MHIPHSRLQKAGTHRSSRTPRPRPVQESSLTRDCFIRILTTFVREWICGWTYFCGGILIGLVVSMFSIGPVGVLCIQRTLSKGQRSGFFSGLGAATADTVYATVAFFRHRIRARLHRTEPVAAENHRRRVRRRGRPLYLFPEPRGADTPQQVRQRSACGATSSPFFSLPSPIPLSVSSSWGCSPCSASATMPVT